MGITDEFYIKEGYICYYEKYAKIYQEIDEVFLSFLNGFNFKVFNIPSLIDGDVLEKCGYFESFPNQITPVCTIDETKMANVMKNKYVDESFIRLHSKFLTPSACLHIYPMYSGKDIKENEIITTKARVYRYENSDFEDQTRLWDFSVREIVFIGEPEFVQTKLEYMKEKALEYAKTFTDKAYLVTSYDHFYQSNRNDIKAKFQLRNEQKFELKLPINGRNVAVASFNFHNKHFSIPFNFDGKNNIVSGCVGFGLERWVATYNEYKKEM